MGFFGNFFNAIAKFAKAVVSKIKGFFGKVVSFVKNECIPRLKQRFGEMLQGIKTWVVKLNGQYQEKEDGYAYDMANDQWTVNEVTRQIPASEVPSEIRERAMNQGKIDTTDRVAEELENAS